jgi:hypothetical protein
MRRFQGFYLGKMMLNFSIIVLQELGDGCWWAAWKARCKGVFSDFQETCKPSPETVIPQVIRQATSFPIG